MSRGKDRQDELFAIALGARRRDAKMLQRDTKAPDPRLPSVPTPRDDNLAEFIRSLSPAQRELFRKWLES